jgi:hypothetical protein
VVCIQSREKVGEKNKKTKSFGDLLITTDTIELEKYDCRIMKKKYKVLARQFLLLFEITPQHFVNI